MNLDNITLQNVVIVNSPAFHFRLTNVGDVNISGCVMRSHGVGTDGLHFDGPANDIKISNCDFMTGDDSIALNCPEGHMGNISRVQVDSCTFNSWSLMRLYTTNWSPLKFTIDSVSVTNCTGVLAEAAFLIGLSDGSLPNSLASLTVSDCTLTAPTILGVAENFGTVLLRRLTFTPSQARVVWVQPQTNQQSSLLRPSPLCGYIPSLGANLTFENCTINRIGSGPVPALVIANYSRIQYLAFNGFTMQDAAGYAPMPALIQIEQGSIGHFVLNALNSANILAPVSEGGFFSVDSVEGNGVLATGWEFPDDIMAEGVPYISASNGTPSVKINGAVQPYP